MSPAELERLRRERPRSRLLAWSLAALGALALYAWLSGEIEFDEFLSQRRLENLERFLSVDIRPYALRDRPFDWGEYGAWAAGIWRERGAAGTLATLAMSVVAIVLAALGAAGLMLFAARNVATREPFEAWPASERPGSSSAAGAGAPAARFDAWRLVCALTRGFLIFLRAIPEYVWAYLFLAMLGPSAWPAVLALAIHNAGILGKLGAETVENLEPRPLVTLRRLGATRAQVALWALAPLSLSRFLLYFFYRFETCVREATVLGMLGVVSLGYWIQDARSKQYYDEMLFLVCLGALIVLVADVLSALARRIVRESA